MTKRQEELLKMIIESYISDGEAIGSKQLIEKYNIKFSSATVRSEMAELENLGYLEKEHTSSGRVPSIDGYKYFAEKLSDKKNSSLEKRLEDIFAKRRVSIDFTIDEAANAITEIAGFTLSITSKDTDELMKSIQLTPINEKMATIVIVTSSGRVESKLIEFNNFVKIDDVRIAIRLFKERLIDTKLRDLSLKVEALSPILSESVKNHEEVIKAFVGSVFDFHNKVQNKVYGNSNIIKSTDIKREDVARLIELVEKKSVWESIESEIDEDEKIKIDIRPDKTALISKRVDSKEISIVGSHRIDYSEAKQAIKLLEKFLKSKGD